MNQDFLHENLTQINSLESIVKNSINEIKVLQKNLDELEIFLSQLIENSLSQKFNFANASINTTKESQKNKPTSSKENILNKIRQIFSKDNFLFQIINIPDENQCLHNLESFLNDFYNSPKSLLKQLNKEFVSLKKKLLQVKDKNSYLIDESGEILKQEILWASVRANEVIAKIKESIMHKMIISH